MSLIKIKQLLSVRRYKRIKGGKQLSDSMSDIDFSELKSNIVTQQQLSELPDTKLGEHLQKVGADFLNQSELLFYHCKLIVLIRREIDLEQNYQRFKQLWLSEQEFLSGRLNLRWLVSACDTFIDHDDDLALRAMMMNVVVLVNTAKLYETERWITPAMKLDYSKDKLEQLATNKFQLFNGVETFTIGQDDSLLNMFLRLKSLSVDEPLYDLPLLILNQLSHMPETIFSRYKLLHTHERTQWWK